MVVLRARPSDSLVAILDRAVHGRSVRSAHFLSQINFRTIRAPTGHPGVCHDRDVLPARR
jgi:hypothetical protein